jgi:type II secretory pathway predicted ATPase ExeA
MPAAELMTYLAAELGVPGGGDASLARSLRRLRQMFSASVERGQRPLLVVDEAHLIDDPATFESLRMLLNFATQGPPDLSLLLVGGPEVLLRLPHGLADRLTARCLLGPLSEAESAAYVLGRLAAVGASTEIFDSQALADFHLAAGGLPRRLNRLADLALLIAYAEGRPGPDTRDVQIATREMTRDELAV